MAIISPKSLTTLAGQQVGSFELVRLLGTGAMGAVYLARDTILRREVALKLLAKGSGTSDTEQQQRFLREARAAARLIHPNVVQIFQIGEAEDMRYIAMEYVPGMTIAKLAKQHGGRLSEEICLHKMREAADALQLAGALGVCHQDIKPANLLLDKRGMLKIADFGLATQVAGSESITTVSAAKQLQGTPYYMSPEQWQGHEIGTATDVYGLGCTFYALLVGIPPYGRTDLMSCFRAHCNAPIPDARSAKPDLDAGFAGLLQRCMAKTPQDRPRPEDIVAGIDEILSLRHETGNVSWSGRRTSSRISGAMMALSEGSAGDAITPHGMDVDTSSVPTGLETAASISYLSMQVGDATAPDLGTVQISYRQHFGLQGYPFSDMRQPDQFWDAGPYAWALRTLALQITEGCRQTMLQGAPGSGRTFLCDILAHRFPRIHTFRIEPELLFGGNMLVALCRQYGLDVNPNASLRFLSEAFLSQVLSEDVPEAIAVLVIDSVDPADDELLADIGRMLRILGTTRLGLLLVGAEDLQEQLAGRGAAALLASGAPPVLLRRMSQDEMVEYIDFRMTTIGGTREGLALDAPMRQFLHARSGGSPKLVNVYCHNALMLAAVRGDAAVGFETLRLAMKRKTYLTVEAASELLAQQGTR